MSRPTPATPPPSSRLRHDTHDADVCVVGGGMAGLCAAIASARNGAKTVLIHDRPVLGGNASSEVRMWVCGAEGRHNKETGLLEEIQLDNHYHNPSLNYPVWDGVLWAKARFQPNLTTLLNAACTDAAMEGDRIASVTAYQSTSQSWHTVRAGHFVDCSGDSILAAVTPAECRVGREGREEFGEDIAPARSDLKTMGNTLLLQVRRTGEPQPFTPPRWAYKFTRPEDLPHRVTGVKAHNFWWLEIGGLLDTVADAEAIRDDLLRAAYGVWDYLKNHAPGRDAADDWAIEWVGALPGKRESRRYVGDHTMTQHDVRRGQFDDVVAYGGWAMDDHHPAGIFYPGKPTIFHAAPSPYGIPFRSLYSRNVPNLLFAGRNISVTHVALSSTRVMGTCAVLGQAAGTAAALCAKHGCDPRSLSSGDRLRELQATLMDDDCFLPGVPRPASDLAASATIAGDGCGLPLLLDGVDRDRVDERHAWVGPVGGAIEMRWRRPVEIGGARVVLDSNLNNDKRMPCSYPQKGDRTLVPSSLLRAFRVDVADGAGGWRTVHRESDNYQRLVKVPVGARTDAVRLVPEQTWGDADARVFGFDPTERHEAKRPAVPDGPAFADVVAALDPADLAPPDSGLEQVGKFSHTPA